MTINQLRQYRHIKANILMFEVELDELILKTKTFDVSGGNPYAVSDTVAQIVLEREKKRDRIKILTEKKTAIENYIAQCDEYYGLLLRWHYIDGKTWALIALHVGGGNTDEGIKKACHRYVRKNP